MPTIVTKDLTTSVSTTQQTHPQADARRAAAIAKIEGRESLQTPSNIAEVAPGSTMLSQVDLNQPPLKTEGPITDLNAKQVIPDVDKRLAEMARKEKQAWSQIKQLKAEKDALAKERSGRMTKEEFATQFRKDPNSLGITQEELGQMYLTQGAPVDPVVARLQAEVQELRQGQQKVVSQAEQVQKQAYDQALAQIDREAKALIDKNNAYEVTRSQSAQSAVTKLIELTYQEEGVLMDVEEAAAQVEAYLEQEALSLFNRSPKLKAKLSPAQQASSVQVEQLKQKQTPQTQRTNTLTHAMVQASSKPLDRRERAIAAWEANKKVR